MTAVFSLVLGMRKCCISSERTRCSSVEGKALWNRESRHSVPFLKALPETECDPALSTFRFRKKTHSPYSGRRTKTKSNGPTVAIATVDLLRNAVTQNDPQRTLPKTAFKYNLREGKGSRIVLVDLRYF